MIKSVRTLNAEETTLQRIETPDTYCRRMAVQEGTVIHVTVSTIVHDRSLSLHHMSRWRPKWLTWFSEILVSKQSFFMLISYNFLRSLLREFNQFGKWMTRIILFSKRLISLLTLNTSTNASYNIVINDIWTHVCQDFFDSFHECTTYSWNLTPCTP